jgi:hypothetical protein
MAAPKGNQFWKYVDPENAGRPRKYKTVEELKKPVLEFFEYVVNNPIEVEQVTPRGIVTKKFIKPLTIYGLCNWLGITFETWKEQKKRNDFSNFCTRIEQMIYDQKFTYASIGEYNANIIARDLGLVDKQESTVDVKKPIKIIKQYKKEE